MRYALCILFLTACPGSEDKNDDFDGLGPRGASGSSGSTVNGTNGNNATGNNATGNTATSNTASSGNSGGTGSSGNSGNTGSTGSTSSTGASGNTGASGTIPLGPTAPAVARGGQFFATKEWFNRYYTDPNWHPTKIYYADHNASGNGATQQTPMSAKAALDAVKPGEAVYFVPSGTAYNNFAYSFDSDRSGTYDAPILLYAMRNQDGTRGVVMNCPIIAGASRQAQTCFNFEGANYIAVDGFELVGGYYGVRAVDPVDDQRTPSRGIAVIATLAHHQCKDPFLTGASEWFVIERSVGHHSGTCPAGVSPDGHAIYLGNGGDWNVVRFNEAYQNSSADFQINADPVAICDDFGVALTSVKCNGAADKTTGVGMNGIGVAEYYLLEGNYFHNGNAQGPNFTSVRNSSVINNIFAFYAKHNTSFWQESGDPEDPDDPTAVPELASAHNFIHHNLFVGTASHLLQFHGKSDYNDVTNNLFLALNAGLTAAAGTQILDLDNTVAHNTYANNVYVGTQNGVGKAVGASESLETTFSRSWFTAFPADKMGTAAGFTPTAGAPQLDFGKTDPGVDMFGTTRGTPPDVGPIEAP